MREDQKVMVYRLMYTTAGQEISPHHMWGTKEAIASLRNCVPVDKSGRQVHRKLLDVNGFLFEHTLSTFEHIETPDLTQ